MADEEQMEVDTSSSNDAPCPSETTLNSETNVDSEKDSSGISKGGGTRDSNTQLDNKNETDEKGDKADSLASPSNESVAQVEPEKQIQDSTDTDAANTGDEPNVPSISEGSTKDAVSQPNTGHGSQEAANIEKELDIKSPDTSQESRDNITDNKEKDKELEINKPGTSQTSTDKIKDTTENEQEVNNPVAVQDSIKTVTDNKEEDKELQTNNPLAVQESCDNKEKEERQESSGQGAKQVSPDDKIVTDASDTPVDKEVRESDDIVAATNADGTKHESRAMQGNHNVLEDSVIVDDGSNADGTKDESRVMQGDDNAVLEDSVIVDDGTAPKDGLDREDSIVLEGADEDGSDDGIQEIHDVEDDDDEEEEANAEHVGRDTQGSSAQHTQQVVFPSPQEHIHHLCDRVKGLESELEMTRKKLTKAEKKLSRSRRHKESAESYNYDLRRKAKHMKKEIHRLRKAAKKSHVDVGCQTQPMEEADHDDVIEIPSTSMDPMPAVRGQDEWGMPDDHGQSLADTLKATAEAALSSSGYVLDPNSGLYYDYSTGYYYDPNNHLYYDPNTGVYYFYDQQTRTYHFHSQVNMDHAGMLPHSAERRRKRKKDRRQRRDTGEDGECEVIEVPDDDSPENKRPKKIRRKQKDKSKVPHTATSEDANKDKEESASKSNDNDGDASKETSKETEKDSRTSKKGSKKSKTKGSRKKSSASSKEIENKEGEVEKEDAGTDKSKDKEIDKDKELDKADNETEDNEQHEDDKSNRKDGDGETNSDLNKDSSEVSSGKNKDGGETSSDKNKAGVGSEDAGTDKPTDDAGDGEANPATELGEVTEQGDATQPRSEEGELESDGEIQEEGDGANIASKNTPVSLNDGENAAKEADATMDTEEDQDDEIMEVENKKKDEIEEITIDDSDTDESEMEEGELSNTSAEMTSSEESSDDSDAVAELVPVTPQDFPACIRMIVTRSDKIQLGSLFIVTCTGGTIGREGTNHVVTIPELGVSKQHAEIKYNEAIKQYSIRDLGSQNGTLINGKMLSKARSVSEPHPLTHKDYLTVGSTTLRIHIHPGTETCDECEPGQVQALFAQLNPELNQVTYSIVTQADKEQMRRKELRKLKKKYNLVRDNYVQPQDPSTSNPTYTDRAGVRRRTVGSDNPYQPDDAPASVDRAIGESNVGRKMLEKMGWKEGTGLGKGDQGIKEPIQVLVRNQKAGLGGGAAVSMDNAHLINQSRQSQRWQRAKARFDLLQQQGGEPSTSSAPQWVKESAVDDVDDDDIEILSPGSDGNSPSNNDNPSTSSSNTAPTETPSVSSTTTEGATTVDVNSESRPKIQISIKPKKGKEQLPTSSVVLDDGDDDEEEDEQDAGNNNRNKDKESAMESNASVEKGEELESAQNGAKGNARKSKRTSNTAINSTNDTSPVDKKSSPESENKTPASTDEAPNGLNVESSENTNVESNEKSKKPRGRGKAGKWAKVGQKGSPAKQGGKDLKTQGKEAGTSEEGASDNRVESQGDASRRRRTRRGGKKTEDMFADL